MKSSKKVYTLLSVVALFGLTALAGCQSEKVEDAANKGMTENQKKIIQDHKNKADNVK